jgi:TRAP-type C4-dicarboxylate transport system permease small subunit
MLRQIEFTLKGINNILEKVMIWASKVMLVLMLGINVLEIFSRTVFSYSFNWVQELSILLLGAMVFLGGCGVYRQKRDAVVTYFIDKFLPSRLRPLLSLLFNTLIIAFLVILALYAIKLQRLQGLARAIYLPITMNWFSFPVIIFAVVSLLIFLEDTLKIINTTLEKGRSL